MIQGARVLRLPSTARCALGALMLLGLLAVSSCGGDGGGNDSSAAPTVAAQPAHQRATAGDAVSFSVAASGNPAPTVQWQHSVDAGANWSDIAGASAATHTIPAVVVGDSGKRFRAVLSNFAGSVATREATLTVTLARLSLLAGDTGSYGNIDGLGPSARFRRPMGLAVDALGNVYVADHGNSAIRKITPAGVVSTVIKGWMPEPKALTVDPLGNVFVLSATAVYKVTPEGSPSLLLGSPFPNSFGAQGVRFDWPTGIASDAAGFLYVVDQPGHNIRKFSPAGQQVSYLTGSGPGGEFNYPYGIAVDASGTVYVSDSGNHSIRKISPQGAVSTLAGSPGVPGTADGIGNAARFGDLRGLTVDAAGNIFVCEWDTGRVRKVTPAGEVTTLPDRYRRPIGIAAGGAGGLYVTEDGVDHVLHIGPGAGTAVFAGAAFSTDPPAFAYLRSVASDSAGNAYVLEGGGISKITVSGAVSRLAVQAGRGLAVDASGNLYVAHTESHTIRKMTPGGVLSTLAGSAGSRGSADGSGSAARFDNPWGLAVDTAGNVYVADSGNNTIRKITPAAVVSTFAGSSGPGGHADGRGAEARFDDPRAIAFDATTGNLWVADRFNHAVRKITPSGVVSTLTARTGACAEADGDSATARFCYPEGIAVDARGNAYVSESEHGLIRKVTPTGHVATLVGKNREVGVRLGEDSRLFWPQGVAVAGPNRLLILSANGVLVSEWP